MTLQRRHLIDYIAYPADFYCFCGVIISEERKYCYDCYHTQSYILLDKILTFPTDVNKIIFAYHKVNIFTYYTFVWCAW